MDQNPDSGYPQAGNRLSWFRIPVIGRPEFGPSLLNAPGQFLLTGSSDPARDTYAHSGAGRIGRLHMRPMSLQESGLSRSAVRLASLWEGPVPFSTVDCDLTALATAACRGGWPGPLGLPDAAALEVPSAYLDKVFDDNLAHRGLDPELGRRVALSLARGAGQPLKDTTIARGLGLGLSPEHARKTVSRYVRALEDLYVVEPLYGWAPEFKSKKRLRTSPKRYFCDPSLTAAVLGLTPGRLLTDGQLFGMLFESLCVRDLRVYCEAQNRTVRPRTFYYRDENGLECDVVLERPDGSWGAVEVKLGESGIAPARASLLKLKDLATRNPAGRVPEPSFLVVLVGSSPYMGTLPDGVTVVPISELGA